MKGALLFRNTTNLMLVLGLLSFLACDKRVVYSFTTIPLQCSLREPKRQPPQFKVPQIPFFNTNKIVSANGNNKANHDSSSSYHKLKSQIENQGAKQSKQGEDDYVTTENVIGQGKDFQNSNKEDNIKILQNRSAIMEHALQFKSKELDTMNRRNTLLQDVVKKLQLSNRNLLDKVHELQHEKEGMHISTDSDELWPPEMEMEVLREEFNSKEMEWENALETAHWKYTRLRDEYLDVQMKLQELMQEISDAEEKATYYEERAAIDDNEINGLRAQIEEKEELIENLKSRDLNDDITKKVMESKLEELEGKVADLEAQNESAKVFIQDLRETSKQKRESIEQIIMNEREKNRKAMNNLKSTQAANIELEAELKKTTDDLLNFRTQAKNVAEQSKMRKEEEEERVKMLTKESLDFAASTVKQVESRERKLKKKLKKIENTLDRKKQQNLVLGTKIEELESAIEEALKRNDQNMDLKAPKNDWTNKISELEVELSKAQDSRNVLCRRELRLRQALEEGRQHYLSQIATNQENWEKKMLAQKMEFDLIVDELKTEVISLNDTIRQQEVKIDELSSSPQEIASDVTDISSEGSPENENNSPKRFQRIRKRVRKLKEWLRS